ncbi:MAG TPA: SH3 domain-containing protein [Methyloceanibacter sp.]|nr:SH3 domain-containing protein [Methyloceanibacter sp.]
MGPSALSQSDTVIRPKSLSERLAAERLAAETPAPPEAMAERFAPGTPRGLNGLSGRTIIQPQRLQGFVPQPARSSNRALLVASMIVSLIPTAIILGLLWQGAIRLPGDDTTIFREDKAPLVGTEQASLASSAPQAETEARPEIALTSEPRIEAKAGEDVPFSIAIDSVDMLPARSIIAIREIPPGATLSQGRPYGSSEWSLTPDEIGDLRLHLPKGVTSGTDMRIELMGADGTILASATTRLEIAQDPRAALVLRSDESDRIDDLIKHGQKMVEVGYLAGARAYFRRAVEAGSGEAALLLGACYDPAFIEKIGAQGIEPDLKEARTWYERAKQLGVADADAKLAQLADQWPDHRNPLQEAQEGAAPPVAEEAGATGGAEASAEPAAPSGQPVPVVPADPASSGKEEWVELSGYVNVRKSPAQTAETLRIAQKGEKLRVDDRKGNWAQVTDPATNETGWVYSRFIDTAQTPAQ